MREPVQGCKASNYQPYVQKFNQWGRYRAAKPVTTSRMFKGLTSEAGTELQSQ